MPDQATAESERKRSKPLSIDAVIADDKRSVTLTFKSDAGTDLIASVDAACVETLLAQLGDARSKMLEVVPVDMPAGIFPLAGGFDPRWYVLPDTESKFTTLWLRHPAFGWSGYGFSRKEAGNISKWLRKVTSITSTRDTHSPSATSFGSDDFLITTEGLGFYYYGKGDKRIGPNPFEQIEFDSDRAAGLVAAAIAEQRLEEALRSRFRFDNLTVSQGLFQPSGALGPFSTKIDLAHLLGILSDEAHRDLINLKNVRNSFAHKLHLDSFDAQSIKDRCMNFALIDRYVGPVPPMAAAHDPKEPTLYLGLPDYEQKKIDPRFRYVMTAQIFSFILGAGSDDPSKPLPLI